MIGSITTPLPDDIYGTLVENTRRNGMQHVLDTIELESMPRVGPSLKACNDIVVLSEDIHDFTFSFVSPLKT